MFDISVSQMTIELVIKIVTFLTIRELINKLIVTVNSLKDKTINILSSSSTWQPITSRMKLKALPTAFQ